jgi:hypothetical protein
MSRCGVHRPFGAGDDAVVVEDAHGARFVDGLGWFDGDGDQYRSDTLGERAEHPRGETRLARAAVSYHRHPFEATAGVEQRGFDVGRVDEPAERHVVDAQVLTDREGVEGVRPLKGAK